MRLGLYLNTSQTKGRLLLRGIHSELENWTDVEIKEIPYSQQLWEGNPLQDLDALLGEFDSHNATANFHQLKIPIINLSNAMADEQFPRSIMDETRIGKIAAKHLLERGYRHFLSLITWGHHASELRAEAFCAEIRRQGREVEQLRGGFIPGHWDVDLIAKAIDQTRSPLGIFGWTDFAAYAAFQAARKLGKPVPEEIGIIGSGDDDVYTSITPKPMTSITLRWESVGVAAVEMLEEAIAGERPANRYSTRSELLPRASTERYPVSDPRVARCLSLIDRNLNSELGIPDLARKVGCSKRTLETCFREELQTSPARYVLRRRIQRACRLLDETGLRVYEISEACGFADVNYFSAAFKRVLGKSPSDYRERAD